MSVLVTPGNCRSALAVTRSLGRRGIDVTIADERSGLAAASRYCQRSIRVPSPARAGAAFVRAIQAEVRQRGHRVLIPADDITLSMVAQARPELEDATTLPFPDVDTIQLAHDKAAVMSLAVDLGIPVPKTVVVQDSIDTRSVIRRVGLPAVVKPRFSKFLSGGQWKSGSPVSYVHTAAELEAACRAAQAIAPFPLVQEFVPGEGRGVFLLMNRGQLRVAFAHRRLREKPPGGGVSVLSESVELEPELLGYAERILHGLKWHGVAMVEFKRDIRDGTTKLLEINGRFWGSLQLAVDAGVDFPYLLYRLATEGDVEPILTYHIGRRLRWWLGDIDWLLLRLREHTGLMGRIGALTEFARSAGPRTRGEVLRPDDPVPACLELVQYTTAAVAGAARRLRRRLERR